MLDLTIKQLKKIQEGLHLLDSVYPHGDPDCTRPHGDLEASALADQIGIVIRAREAETALAVVKARWDPLSVRCTTCNAKPWADCVNPEGRPIHPVHDARIDESRRPAGELDQQRQQHAVISAAVEVVAVWRQWQRRIHAGSAEKAPVIPIKALALAVDVLTFKPLADALAPGCPCGHAWALHDIYMPSDPRELCCEQGCDQKGCPGQQTREHQQETEHTS